MLPLTEATSPINSFPIARYNKSYFLTGIGLVEQVNVVPPAVNEPLTANEPV